MRDTVTSRDKSLFEIGQSSVTNVTTPYGVSRVVTVTQAKKRATQ
jgi:hypothetical protein